MPHEADIILNGVHLTARSDGSLFWRDRATLIVADLHFEKGSSFARTGQLLPPYDSRETLNLLAAAIRDTNPDRVVCLGDSFHDAGAAARLPDDERGRIRSMSSECDWVWVEGNHDPDPPKDLGGTACAELTDGPLVFRHEAADRPVAGEISGHYHPKVTVQARARRLSGRCFVEDGKRLIMPSFGAFTGGLSVHDPAISKHFHPGFRVHLTTRHGILSMTGSRTLRAA